MKRPRLRQKFRLRLARRLGLFPPPLRHVPRIQAQYLLFCRTKCRNKNAVIIHAAWPGRFRRNCS